MKHRVLALVAVLAACTANASTQGTGEPMRVGIVVADLPSVGRPMPDFSLPYATRDGAGPADQPFVLAKELGRVVVLSFCRLDIAEECLTQWRTFRDQQPRLFGQGDVVVAGVTIDSAQGVVRFAQDQALPFKFLVDPTRAVARRFGFTRGDAVRHTVVVIGRTGRVRYLDPDFAAFNPNSYNNLAAAVQAAKES